MRTRKAFTLIELLVSIGIIIVLAALIIPATQAARESSRRMQCGNKLRQMGIAMHQFHDRNGYTPSIVGRYGKFVHWHTTVLPDLEQKPLYETINRQMEDGVTWSVLDGLRVPVTAFQCPSDPIADRLVLHHISGRLFAPTNFVGIVGRKLEDNDGMFPSPWVHRGVDVFSQETKIRFSDITDGLSNTLAIAERPIANEAIVGAWQSSQEYGHQAIGVAEDLNLWKTTRSVYLYYSTSASCGQQRFDAGTTANICDQFHPWSLHAGGANFVRGDGSLVFLSYQLDQQLLETLSTISGHEAAASQ